MQNGKLCHEIFFSEAKLAPLHSFLKSCHPFFGTLQQNGVSANPALFGGNKMKGLQGKCNCGRGKCVCRTTNPWWLAGGLWWNGLTSTFLNTITCQSAAMSRHSLVFSHSVGSFRAPSRVGGLALLHNHAVHLQREHIFSCQCLCTPPPQKKSHEYRPVDNFLCLLHIYFTSVRADYTTN